ncbi:MAG: nitrous oxide reductase family maturation protein NosD [Chlorobi bacterium]|nr:nitrous oxide reductase family maturation protein NosD [Chlorobiota bacterium]
MTLSSHSKTIEVCSDCEVRSIKQAVDLADSGDTIMIQEGRYQESNIILKVPRVVLIGKGKVIIDANKENQAIIVFRAPNVVIKNIVIKNVPFSSTEELAAINILYSSRYTIENVVIDSTFFGILIEQSDSGVIRGCTISSGSSIDVYEATIGNGIHLWKSNYALIENNDITNMRDGIYFEFVSNSVIRGNYSYGNKRYGLHFMFSNDDVYENNRFEGNGAGVAVMFSKNISMHSNVFSNNWGMNSYGLLLKEIYDSEIKHNVFVHNTTAIHIEGSTRIIYEENDLIENGWAVNFIGGSYDNFFYHNNFMGNTFDVAYFGRVNNNRFEENYWNKYTGYDLDRDGFGDVPYRPVDLFTYMVNEIPETIVLLRSFFVQILNFAEQVVPVLTPADIYDPKPLMQKWKWSDS